MAKLQASQVKPSVLIAWLKEAHRGGVDSKGMKRLCGLAAEHLEIAYQLEKLKADTETKPETEEPKP